VQVLNVMKMGGNTLVELSVDSNLLDPNGFPYVAGLAGEGLLVQLLSPVSPCFAGLAGEGLLVKLLSPLYFVTFPSPILFICALVVG